MTKYRPWSHNLRMEVTDPGISDLDPLWTRRYCMLAKGAGYLYNILFLKLCGHTDIDVYINRIFLDR